MNENEAVCTMPKMMSIREVARTGILPENTIRQMVKLGTCPHIMAGNKALINYTKLVKLLEGC